MSRTGMVMASQEVAVVGEATQGTAVIERRLLRAMGQAIGDFGLIQAGDRLLVAVSGGKDSLTLLHLLLKLQGRAPIRFELAAVNLDPGYPGYRPEQVAEFCEQQGVKVHCLSAPIHQLVQEKLAPEEPACPLCSRIRRGAFYTLAQQFGYTKIALGHHLDDVIETVLINTFYAGRLRGMPPRLQREEGADVIRPLCYVLERDIAAYAQAQAFPIIPCASPHCAASDRRRQTLKRLLSTLEAEHPDIKNHMRRALSNVELSSLFAGAGVR